MNNPFRYWDSTNTGHPKRKKVKIADSNLIDDSVHNNIWLSYTGELAPIIGEFGCISGNQLNLGNVGIITDEKWHTQHYMKDNILTEYEDKYLVVTLLNGKTETISPYFTLKISKEETQELVEYFKKKSKISEKFNTACFELTGFSFG